MCRCALAPLPDAYKGMLRRLRATPRPAMTTLAHLLLAACALAAPLHAASIPDTADLQKKIPATLPDDIKDPLPADHEIIAPEPAKEIGNELRAKPEDIPVVVVEDAEPSVKINEVDGEEVKRPTVDLRNPGPPQRQEHETQNPERHSDEKLKVSTIKENIEQTQNLLRQSFQDVSDNIQNWVYKNDDPNKIQKNIQSLRETFSSQIQKLNDTIQTLVKPDASEFVELQAEGSQRNYKQIQSGLRILEDNFNNNVETLSAGVELVASLRSRSDAGDAVKEETPVSTAAPGSSTTPAAPASSQNIFTQFVTTVRDQMLGSFSAIQNLIVPTTQSPLPAGAQADTPVTQAPVFGFFNRPNITFSQLPNLPNLQNFTNLPNLPTLPNLSNLFRPDFWQGLISGTSTPKPAEAASSPAADKPTVSKPEADVSDKPADAAASPPAAAPAPAAVAESTQPGGPIRQFLSNNPVVQRIQNSITNRDTPRVPAEKSDGQSKGGWYGPPGRPGGSGDNNDSRMTEKKSEEVKDPIKEESIKEESIKEESIREESIKGESIKEESIKDETIKEESKKEEDEIRPESIPEKTE